MKKKLSELTLDEIKEAICKKAKHCYECQLANNFGKGDVRCLFDDLHSKLDIEVEVEVE